MINFPITKIHIVGIDGKTIKEYQKSGRYIMDTEIKGSTLEMVKDQETRFTKQTQKITSVIKKRKRKMR